MSDNHSCQRPACSGDIEDLENQVKYWQEDSAIAWNRCEERRVENEKLRNVLEAAKRYISNRDFERTWDLKDAIDEYEALQKLRG